MDGEKAEESAKFSHVKFARTTRISKWQGAILKKKLYFEMESDYLQEAMQEIV